jgi:hypothetical protein
MQWAGLGGPPVNTNIPVSIIHGVALDETTRRIYWVNQGSGLVHFNPMALIGTPSDEGTVSTTGATKSTPGFPALLKAPAAAAAPAISGGTALGSGLACSQGDWAPDQLAGFTYQVPSSFDYQWTRDGADVPGATSSSLTAEAPGEYRCRVTARNFAGATSQTSAPHEVDPSNEFTIGKPKRKKAKGTARLPVTVPGPGELSLEGKKVVSQRPAGGERADAETATTVDSAGTVKLLVKSKGKAKRKLKETGKTKVRLTVTFIPTGGTPASQDAAVKLKLADKRG